MKLVYQGKEIRLKECKSFFSRFKGLMGKVNIEEALLFNHCNSIHTFFMREAIEVILCDENNKILGCEVRVKPNRVILPRRGVKKVFELPEGYFLVKIGEKMEVRK